MLAAVVLGTVLQAILPIWPLPPPPVAMPTSSMPILASERSTASRRTHPMAEVLGRSTGGTPVRAYWVGDGPDVVVIQGALHGGPELNTALLALQLRDHYQAHPEELPDHLSLVFIPEANPDGIATDSRQYLSGVDPNRNWDTRDWSPDGYTSGGRWERGLGGPFPMSEPETRWLAAWLLDVRPVAVVQYHSRGGFVEGTLALAQPYSRASGYTLAPYPDALLGYRTAGTLAQWLTEHDIDTVLIELSSSTATEFERNRVGLAALLQAVSATVPPAATAPWVLPTSLPFIR